MPKPGEGSLVSPDIGDTSEPPRDHRQMDGAGEENFLAKLFRGRTKPKVGGH